MLTEGASFNGVMHSIGLARAPAVNSPFSFWLLYLLITLLDESPMMYSSTDLINWKNLGSQASSISGLWRPKIAKPDGSYWVFLLSGCYKGLETNKFIFRFMVNKTDTFCLSSLRNLWEGTRRQTRSICPQTTTATLTLACSMTKIPVRLPHLLD
jgi:hypothetical protein